MLRLIIFFSSIPFAHPFIKSSSLIKSIYKLPMTRYPFHSKKNRTEYPRKTKHQSIALSPSSSGSHASIDHFHFVILQTLPYYIIFRLLSFLPALSSSLHFIHDILSSSSFFVLPAIPSAIPDLARHLCLLSLLLCSKCV